MWVQLIWFIISLAVSYALRPKPVVPKAAGLADIQVPNIEEGKNIGMVFGTVILKSPSVVTYSDLKTTAIKSSGGKK